MKTIEKIVGDYGRNWGYEVHQNVSMYSATLHFGPCQTTLDELFDRGFYIYCHVRNNCRRDGFTTGLYLTDGNNQYKIGTVSRKDALNPNKDLGVFIERPKGDMESRGSVDISKYRIAGDISRNMLYNLEVFFAELLGEDNCMREIFNQETFKSTSHFDWELVKDEILTRLKNTDVSQDAEFDVMEALESVLKAYPKPKKKKPVTMVGNQTLPEYVISMASGIS